MKSIVIVPLEIEVLETEFVRRCQFKRLDEHTEVSQQELWFRFSKKINPPEDMDCDSYLLAILMDAMQEGRKIVVKGSVSNELLSNLVEYQSAWNKWLPDTYNLIDIDVETIRNNTAPVPGAICAFSGGVDATFSVWRHSQNKYSYRSQTINLCSVVHGFDIPLHDQTAFSNTEKRIKQTLSDIGIELVPIATNFREISKANWEYSHAAALVSTLSNFKRAAGTCIIGSSDSYDEIIIPWGSSPITDHLLSSDDFRVMHDGSSHSRSEKVSVISEWEMGIDNLRVCWEGDLKDRNCGKCEKCLRTKLNFLASNNPIPRCFEDFENAELDLKNFTLKNDTYRAEWREILNYANKHGTHGDWLPRLDMVIRRRPIAEIFLPKGSRRRAAAKHLAGLLGRN